MAEHGHGKGATRRTFLRAGLRSLGFIGLGGIGVALAKEGLRLDESVWQIDPQKCTACGQCATHCVLNPSAVRCVHAYGVCGYCRICAGFHELEHAVLNSAAENQVCPTGAITRSYVEDKYYEYTIDEERCIGCAICVKGCTQYGNGSLYLQVRHDLCVGCNECAIAAACPAQAFERVPIGQPYLLKKGKTGEKRAAGAQAQKAPPGKTAEPEKTAKTEKIE